MPPPLLIRRRQPDVVSLLIRDDASHYRATMIATIAAAIFATPPLLDIPLHVRAEANRLRQRLRHAAADTIIYIFLFCYAMLKRLLPLIGLRATRHTLR